MNSLEGKVAIVTGSATGIGYGISKRLANDGANLVMVDIDANMLEQAASEVSARTREVEISIGETKTKEIPVRPTETTEIPIGDTKTKEILL